MAELGRSRSARCCAQSVSRPAATIFQFLASLKLAVVLLASLAAVLAWATILETKHSAAYAQWYVYESSWFFGLLALLGSNILCAALSRLPWKRHHTGFVVTHAGLLVLLAGAVWSFVGGVEGRLTLTEGQSADDIVIDEGSQITAFWVGRPQEPSFEFTFQAGPVDRPQGKALNLGEIDGVKARILGFYANPRPVEAWVPDPTGLGGPVLKFRVRDQSGTNVAEDWLSDQKFGDAVAIGPVRLQLEQAMSQRMSEDFLQPVSDDFGEKGLLAMYFGDVSERISIDRQLGERISLGNTGVTVEIHDYLPNASPDKLGKFTTKGDQPKNPMVELRVHLPDEAEPLRQIAFAKDPFLNLDGVYPRVCPVKFRFHHPAIQQKAAIELLQDHAGKLSARSCADGVYTTLGQFRAGDKIAMPGGFSVEIVEHLPHACRQVSFAADGVARRKNKSISSPAAHIEISAGGLTERVWLRRDDPSYARSAVVTPSGTMALNFERGRVPLGFTVSLIDFRREQNPGSAGNATFSSRVRIVDSKAGHDREHVISMNQPLTYGNFTFYQSSFEDAGHGRESSTFSVAHDPGRTTKYAGSLMICAGVAIMFYMRAYFFKGRSRDRSCAQTLGQRTGESTEQQQTPLRPAA